MYTSSKKDGGSLSTEPSQTNVQEGAVKDTDVELQELKAELESSQSIRDTLERQVQDLRKALRATGTPTEACGTPPLHDVAIRLLK